MRYIRNVLLSLVAYSVYALCVPAASTAQCTGQFQANQVCGTGSSAGLPTARNATSVDLASYCAAGSNVVTCMRNAIVATPSGGTLRIPRAGYTSSGSILIDHPMNIECGGADPNVSQHVAQTTTSSNLIVIRSNNVTIDGCTWGLAGTPTGSATGIVIGDDATRVTNGGSFTNGSATLTCATCTFTSADVGKQIYASNVGAAGAPLFTSIAAFIDATHVTMGTTAGATQAAQTFGYGYVYTDVRILNNEISNFVIGIHKVSAQRAVIDNTYVIATYGSVWESILWGDVGDDFVTNSTFYSVNNATGIAFQYTSGGGLKFANNKVLQGFTCFNVFWSYESSLGPWMANNSIEGACTHGIGIDGTGALYGGNIVGGEVGVAGAAIYAAPTGQHPNWTFANIHVRSILGNSGFDIANMLTCNLQGNQIESDGTGGATGYVIRATSTNCVVNVGATNIARTTNSLTSTTKINDPVGLTVANLSSAADGSRVWVSDGNAGTAPCTGGGSGAPAVRKGGQWVCDAPSYTGTGNYVLATNATLVTPTLGVANATSINKVAITAPATSATLTIANGKTLTASNTLTFTGTDSSSVAFGAGGTVAYTGGTLAQFASTTSAELAGVISNETGSGSLVFATTPTLVTPVLGAATGTSVLLGGGSFGSAGEILQLNGNVANHLALRINNSNASGFNSLWFGSSNEGFIRYNSGVGDKLQIVASVASVPVTLATAGTDRLTVNDGQIRITPTTAATSTTDGALRSDGGLSVAGSAVVGGTVRANTAFSANGTAGQSVTTTVRASGGAADCTLIFTFGLKTGGTC